MSNRTILATAARFAAGALLGWLAGVGHWSKPAQAQDQQPVDANFEGAGPKPATEHTRKANAVFARTLPFADQRDFDEGKKGLIAPLPGGGVVKNTDGRVVWDPRRYNFIKLDGVAPVTVYPSLWRQAQLLSLTGLFQVTDQIYQVRGYDISNITFIPPTDSVTKTGQKLTIDGLTYEFQMAPGTEAPAEMHFFIHEYRALCPAENATQRRKGDGHVYYWRLAVAALCSPLMPRAARACAGGVCYPVINRGNGRRQVFYEEGDYHAFLRALAHAGVEIALPVLGLCLMPNPFHLVVLPNEDGDLSRSMHGVQNTQGRHYHQH